MDPVELEAQKRASVGQLLLKAARLLDERAVARIASRTTRGPKLRTAHTRLLPHIALEGTRLVDLAKKIGVTKQAISQTVGEMVEMGVVELAPDPEDARAKLVRFTPRGLQGISHGLAVLAEIEGELAARVGKKRMSELRETLAAIVDALEQR